MDANSWHHLVVIRDGTNYSVFLNGVFVSSDVTTTGAVMDYSDNRNNVVIGAVADPSGTGKLEFFHGQIDDVRIYGRALTEIEVSALYLAEAPPPSIVQNPSAQILMAGSNAVFSVIADGRPPLAFQWLHDDLAMGDATNSTLTIGAFLNQ